MFKGHRPDLAGDASADWLEARKNQGRWHGRTSVDGVWQAGLRQRWHDLTVDSVAEGRDAAMDIHMVLMRLSPLQENANG